MVAVATNLGTLSAATYLAILPFGHITFVRSLSLTIALGTAIYLLAASRTVKAPPMTIVFGFWLLAALLSLTNATDPDHSLSAIDKDLLKAILAYSAIYFIARHHESFSPWILATAASTLALGGLAIYSWSIHGRWVAGVLPALGDYATVLVTVAPLLVWAATHRRFPLWLRVASGSSLAAGIIGGTLTDSRGLWLGLGVALLTVCVLNYIICRRNSGGARWLTHICLLLLSAVSIIALVAAWRRGISIFFFGDRYPIYAAVFRKLADNPLTGTGFGHEADALWYQGVDGLVPNVFHAHNVVLSYADQMGPLGLIALFMLFGAPLTKFTRASWSPHQRQAAFAGAAMVLAVFSKNSFDYFFTRAPLFLYFGHLALYFSWLEHNTNERPAGPEGAAPCRAPLS